MLSLCKKTFVFVLAMTSFLSSISYAGSSRGSHNRCLEQASHSEILNELNYRLSRTGPPPVVENNYKYSVACDNNRNLLVIVTDPNTGSSTTNNVKFDYSSDCERQEKQLKAKIGKSTNGPIVSVACDSNRRLQKIILLNGILSKETMNFDYMSDCQKVEADFN